MKIIRNETKELLDFANLNVGDCFTFLGDDEILMKVDWEQDAVSLENGDVYENMCGVSITLVKTELIVN